MLAAGAPRPRLIRVHGHRLQRRRRRHAHQLPLIPPGPLFKRDANYSAYSYARFWDLDEGNPAHKEQIHTMWAEDVANMVEQYEQADNLHYYIPYMRKTTESHCTTIINWTGTEIENTGVEVGDYIDDLLDGGSVTSYEEGDNPSDKNVSDLWHTMVDLFLQALAWTPG